MLSEDHRWLRYAIELSDQCPPSPTAFSVGAVVVVGGQIWATGHSREGDPADHAEEAALAKLDHADPNLVEATIYSSLEPCSSRSSRPDSCTDLILTTPIRRVVFAWREPAIFVDGEGAERLRAGGCDVIELSGLASDVRARNTHLLTD